MAAEKAPTFIDKLSEKQRRYSSDDLEVTWSAVRCIHFKACVRGLPDVFNVEQKPWIQPAEAEPEEVVATVLRCPTGALHVRREGSEPDIPEENLVSVAPDGPLYVHGDAVVKNHEGEVLLKDTRVALCRCGASAHKPLCDGSHTDAKFKDSGALAASRVDQGQIQTEQLEVTATKDGPLQFKGPLTLRSVDGLSVYTGDAAALCRCGASRHRPFCDGSHEKVGFSAE